MEVDLEKGNLFVGPSSMKATDTGTGRNAVEQAPNRARRHSRRPPLLVNFERSESPPTEDKPNDPSKIITNCNCEGSQNLTILPFILPNELGLSRVHESASLDGKH